MELLSFDISKLQNNKVWDYNYYELYFGLSYLIQFKRVDDAILIRVAKTRRHPKDTHNMKIARRVLKDKIDKVEWIDIKDFEFGMECFQLFNVKSVDYNLNSSFNPEKETIECWNILLVEDNSFFIKFTTQTIQKDDHETNSLLINFYWR